jgi:TetR/AcrR family transcriptional repressor of nem operon
MGRTPGATAAGTSERLLRAAADVFARRGYDGARVADIAQQAGLSNGALYAYFGSKAELLVGALRAHGRQLLSDLVRADPSRSVTELLLETGRSLRRRRDPDGYLLVEGLVAARRDAEVAGAVGGYVGERAEWLAGLVRQAQDRGELDPQVPPDAMAHFCLALAVGTALLPPDLLDVDERTWAAFLGRLVRALAPPTPPQRDGNPS